MIRGFAGSGGHAGSKQRRSLLAASFLAPALALLGLAGVVYGSWIPLKAELSQVLLRVAWQRAAEATRADPAETKPAEAIRRPWPWADTWPVARLRVPGQGIDQVVLEGDAGAVLAFGPGRSALGVSGGYGSSGVRGVSGGHVVLGGHRDTHFAFLRHLAVGDEIRLESLDGQEVLYRVARTAVVDHRDTVALGLDCPPRLSLVTCWPFGTLEVGGPWRFVVQAEPVPRMPGGGVKLAARVGSTGKKNSSRGSGIPERPHVVGSGGASWR